MLGPRHHHVRGEGGRPAAELTYSAITSLDGYVADKQGNFDWAAPGDEVHAFVNGLERPIATYLYGRRMYEVMRYWETAHTAVPFANAGIDFRASRRRTSRRTTGRRGSSASRRLGAHGEFDRRWLQWSS
jgi:hypothetical protein